MFRLACVGLSLSAVAGCTTFGGAGSADIALAQPSTPATGSALLDPLEGGLISRAGVDRLSRTDRLAALQSEYRALEFTAPGDRVSWGGGALSGEVVPSQPYRVGSQDCRQYTHTVATGTVAPTVLRGTACRNPDGSWSLLS